MAKRFCFTRSDRAWKRRPPAGDFEFTGLGIIVRQNGPDAQALRRPAAGDVFGQFFDRNAALDAPDVGLAQHDFGEGNV
nr:hypothetical protein [Arenibacterium halophilum]